MARSHAKILSSIWSDPDFCARSSGAQRLYMLLLSQPRLTLVGLLDYMPAKWAKLASDTTVESVLECLAELSEHRYVFIDEDTDELVIRTFLRHDGFVGRNSNLLKGMWSAWATIRSPKLRATVVENMPEEVWGDRRCQPHPNAILLRSGSGPSQPPEPPRNGQSSQLHDRSEPAVPTSSSDQQSEPTVCAQPPAAEPDKNPLVSTDITTSSDQQSELVVGTVLPPSSCLPPPAAAAAEPVVPATGRAPADAAQRRRTFVAAVDLLTDRHLERHPSEHNARRHRSATRRGKLSELRDDAMRLLDEHPTWEPTQLADALEPDSVRRSSPTAGEPHPSAACPDCNGTNLVPVGPNEMRWCDHPRLREAS